MLSRLLHPNSRDFSSLDEREILSLAVGAEEEDGAIYAEIATRLRDKYPASAKVFDGMSAEEDVHRRRLLDLYVEKFGPRLVPIRREHVRGFLARKPVWLMETMTLEQVRQLAWEMEAGAASFYDAAAGRTTDVAVRKLLGDLAVEERGHANAADRLEAKALGPEERAAEKSEEHRQFVLTYVQPGLAGSDGWVGLDARSGVCGSLCHRRHLADLSRRPCRSGWRRHFDGLYRSRLRRRQADRPRLTAQARPRGGRDDDGGRARPRAALPDPRFRTATAVAAVVVVIELWSIAYIQQRYMQTPFWRAALQVVLGGALVFAAGVLIGSA